MKYLFEAIIDSQFSLSMPGYYARLLSVCNEKPCENDGCDTNGKCVCVMACLCVFAFMSQNA